MFKRKLTETVLGHQLWIAALLALASLGAVAQEGQGTGRMMQDEEIAGMPIGRPLAPTPFYQERTFLVLFGVGIGGVGILAYRVGRSRWRRKRAPAGIAGPPPRPLEAHAVNVRGDQIVVSKAA